jgi:hypothetical protein
VIAVWEIRNGLSSGHPFFLLSAEVGCGISITENVKNFCK